MSHPRPLHWRWVKEQREQIAGWQCEWLGCAEPWNDGHHRTYENYGDERPDDIRLLCRRHHDTAHYDLGPAPDQMALSLEDYYMPDNVVDLHARRIDRYIRELDDYATLAVWDAVERLTPSQRMTVLCNLFTAVLRFGSADLAEQFPDDNVSIRQWMDAIVRVEIGKVA